MSVTQDNKPSRVVSTHPRMAVQIHPEECELSWSRSDTAPEQRSDRRILWVLDTSILGVPVLLQALARECPGKYGSVDIIRAVKRANNAEIFDLVFEAIGDRIASEKASIRVDGARLDGCGKPNARSLEPRTQSSRTNVGSATTSWLRNMTNSQGRSKP